MKTLLIILLVMVIAAAAYYAISPVFIAVRVDEAPPEERGAGSEAVAVVPTPTHPARGTARIVFDGMTSYLRYENFKTLNGPDLYVYLATDLSAKEFIDLGRLKATEGNVNYEIPAGVDPREYPYALVWCKAFGVLFNSAKLY